MSIDSHRSETDPLDGTVQEIIDSASEEDTPWRDEEVLRQLYLEHSLSLRQIASQLDCHHSTIYKWIERFQIPTREAVAPEDTLFESNTHPTFYTNEAGYTYAISWHNGERFVLGIHEITVILGGADPGHVFSDDTHCHHHLHKMDIPDLLEVMDATEHNRLHASGDFDEEDNRIVRGDS